MTSNDDKFLDDVRQALDQSLDELDSTTRTRLTRARNLALERGARPKFHLFYWGAIPAAGVALFLLLLNFPNQMTSPLATPDISELSILASAEPLDFYQEEMEFYEWLSEVMETEKELSEQRQPPVGPVAVDHMLNSAQQRGRTS